MDFTSPTVVPPESSDTPFDVQGFKDLLNNLRESRAQKKEEVTPLYKTEE